MERKNYLDLKLKIMKILIILNIFFLLVSNVNATEDKNKIAILVNDNVITNYDIEQRIKMFAILNQINITPENSNSITNNIVNELIDNLLKIEKINEYNISVKNSDIERLENQYFKKIGISKEKIFELMKFNRVDTDQFYQMLYNDIAWQTLISKLYYRITSVSDEEIEELLNQDPQISREMAEQIIMDKQLGLKSSKMLRDLRDEATIEYK
tara:strand:- start:1184 stop:1819 length:636 start_codon:yes stop_codon:yes gene_type:complete